MIKRLPSALLGATLLVALACPAYALNTRTWISGAGVDQAGCGPIAAPCRTLQYAHDNTTASGEVDVLNPAGYGSLRISKSINIINDGVGVAGVLANSSSDAITVSVSSSDKVVLRGLTIEGNNSGANGINMSSAGSLSIQNCIVQGFVKNTQSTGGVGILVDGIGSMSVTIINTTVTENETYGVLYMPGGLLGVNNSSVGVVTIDHVSSIKNGYGIGLINEETLYHLTSASISNSLVSQNSKRGIDLAGSTAGGGVDRFQIDSNVVTQNGSGGSSDTGLSVSGAVNVFFLNNRLFANNNVDIKDYSSPQVFSAKNNYFVFGGFTNVAPFTPY